MAPLDTLLDLDESIRSLNLAQKVIDWTRSEFPNDGSMQLQLDRHQTRVDDVRRQVEEIMTAIASSN